MVVKSDIVGSIANGFLYAARKGKTRTGGHTGNSVNLGKDFGAAAEIGEHPRITWRLCSIQRADLIVDEPRSRNIRSSSGILQCLAFSALLHPRPEGVIC